jgi:hypothetical protein
MPNLSGSTGCPRCGASLPPDFGPRRGRRRIWCSDRCRRDAYAERAAAARTEQPIRVVEVPRAALPIIRPQVYTRLVHDTTPVADPTPAQAAECVLASPIALDHVLQSLTSQARKKTLDRNVRHAALELAKVLLPGQRRY